MAEFISKQYKNPYEYKNPYTQEGSYTSSPNPYANPYKISNPYGYWQSTPMPDRPFINYNDPTELNSLADVIMTTFNPDSIVRDFKWGGMSDIPLLNIIPGMAEVLYKTTIRPIKEGDWTALALNNLMTFTENINIIANPIKAVAQGYGWDGFKQALGWDDDVTGRKNFDFNTGNLAADIALEIIIDPLNWITLGAKSAVTAGTKAGLRTALKTSLGDVAAKGIIDVAEAGAEKFIKKTVKEATEAVQTGVYKTFDEAIVKGIEAHSSNDFAARFMTAEGKPVLTQVGELLRKQALDDQSIRILESTSKLLAPALNFEKKIMLGALNGTPVGASGYLLYKGTKAVNLFANKRLIKAAEAYLNSKGSLDILRAAQAKESILQEVLPLNQALKRTGAEIDGEAVFESMVREAIRANMSEVRAVMKSVKSGLFEDVRTITEHMDEFKSQLRELFQLDAEGVELMFNYMKSNDRPPMGLDAQFFDVYSRIQSNAATLDKMVKDIRYAASRDVDLTSEMQRELLNMKIRELHPGINSITELIKHLRGLSVDHPEIYDKYLEVWINTDKALRAEAKTERAVRRMLQLEYEDVNMYARNLNNEPIIPPAFIDQHNEMLDIVTTGFRGADNVESMTKLYGILDDIVKNEKFIKLNKETQELYFKLRDLIYTYQELKVFDNADKEKAYAALVAQKDQITNNLDKAKNRISALEGQLKQTMTGAEYKANRNKLKIAKVKVTELEEALNKVKKAAVNSTGEVRIDSTEKAQIIGDVINIDKITRQQVNIEFLDGVKIESRNKHRARLNPDGTPDKTYEDSLIEHLNKTLQKTGAANAKFRTEPFDLEEFFPIIKQEVKLPEGMNLVAFNHNLIKIIDLRNIGETVRGVTVSKEETPFLYSLWDKYTQTLKEFTKQNLKTKQGIVTYVTELRRMRFNMESMLRTSYADRTYKGFEDVPFEKQEYEAHLEKVIQTIEEVESSLISAPVNKMSRDSVWYSLKMDQEMSFEDVISNAELNKKMEAVLNEFNVVDPVTKSIDGVGALVDALTLVYDSVNNTRSFLSFIKGRGAELLSPDVRSSFINTIQKSATKKITSKMTDEEIGKAAYHIVRETEAQLRTTLMDQSSKLELFYLDPEFAKKIELAGVTPHTAEGDTLLTQLVVEREFPELVQEMADRDMKMIYMDLETDGRPNGEITEMVMRLADGTVYKFIQKPTIIPSEKLLQKLYKNNPFFQKAFEEDPTKKYKQVYEAYMDEYATQHGKSQYELLEEVLDNLYSMKFRSFNNTGRLRMITWNGAEFDLPFLRTVLNQEEARIGMELNQEEYLVALTRINKMRTILDGRNMGHTDALSLYQKKKGFAEISRPQKQILLSRTQALFKEQRALMSEDTEFELDLLQLPDSKLLDIIAATRKALDTYNIQHLGYVPPITLEQSLSELSAEIRAPWIEYKTANREMRRNYILAKDGFALDDAVLTGGGILPDVLHVNQALRSYVDAKGIKHMNEAAWTGLKKGYDPIVVSRVGKDDIMETLNIIDNIMYQQSLGKAFNIVANTANSIVNTALFNRTPLTPEIMEILGRNMNAHIYLRHAELGRDTLIDYAIIRYLLKSATQAEPLRKALDLLTDDASKKALKLVYSFDDVKRLTFSENELNFRKIQTDEFTEEFNTWHKVEKPAKEDYENLDTIYATVDSFTVDTPLVDLKKTIDTLEEVYNRHSDFISVLHQAANTQSLHEGARALLDKRTAQLQAAYKLGRKIATDVRGFVRNDGSVDLDGFQKYMKYHAEVQHQMARQQMKIVLSFDDDTLAWALLRSKRMMFVSILGFENDIEIMKLYTEFQKRLTPEFSARTGIYYKSNMKTVESKELDKSVMDNVILNTPIIYDEIIELIYGKTQKGWTEISEGLTNIRNRLHDEDLLEMTDEAIANRATINRIDSFLFAGKNTARELQYPKILDKFINSHLMKVQNSIYNNPHITYTGNEVQLVLSSSRTEASVIPTDLPRLDITEALRHAKLLNNDQLARLYINVHNQQDLLVGAKLDFSMGEVAGRGLYEDIFNVVDDSLKKQLPDADELLHFARMDSNDTNTSIIGSALYRSILQPSYPRSMAEVYLSSAKYHAMTSDTVVGYMQLFFDEIHSINNGILSTMSNTDLLAALKGAPEQRLVALIKDPKSKTGARVVEIIVRNEQDLIDARKLNPVFMHYQTFSKAFQTINDFHFDNMWLRMVQKFTYLTKMGYLMTTGAVMRNVVDAIVKNAIVTESPLEMMHYYVRALTDEMRYSEAIKAIIQHSKHNRIQLQSIDWYFSSANPQPSKMTREEFSRLHIFKQDGPSAGQGAEMEQAYRASFNQTYEGWQTKMKEAREEGDELAVEYYKKMIATQDRTPAQELWATANVGVEFMLKPTQGVETIARYAEYMWALERGGKSQPEAYSLVAKTHFEYGLKNPSEYIAELIIPFYTFTMRNLEFWIDAMSNNPKLFSIIGDTMRPIWDFDSISQEELENNRSLQYSLLQGNIEFDDTHLTLKLNPSYMDVYNILTQPPVRYDEGTIDGSMWSRVNSGLKYPIAAMLLAVQDQEAQTGLQAAAAYLPAIGPLLQRYGEQAPRYAERLEGHPISQALASIEPSVFGANSRWKPKSPKKKTTYSSYSGAGREYSRSGRRTYFKRYYPNQKAGRYESFYSKHYSKKGNSKQSMRMTKLTPKMLQYRLKDMFYYYR